MGWMALKHTLYIHTYRIGENKLVRMDKDIEHSFEAIIRLNNMYTATYVPGSAPRAL